MKKIFLVLIAAIFFFFSPATAHAWAHPNGQAAKCTGGPATCGTTAFTSPLTNGSTILAYIFNSNGTATTWTVTDTAGNTYNDCGTGSVAQGSGQILCFIALNTHTTASNVVTMNHVSGTESVLIIIADEFTGNAASNVIDVFTSNPSATSTTGSNNMTCGTITTNFNGDLVSCYIISSAGNSTVGTGFTQDTIQGTSPMSEHIVQGSAGSITPTQTDSVSSDPYAGITVALKVPQVAVANPVGFGGKSGMGGKIGL